MQIKSIKYWESPRNKEITRLGRTKFILSQRVSLAKEEAAVFPMVQI
ncbi:MAG: hypothetical protein LBI70_01725 [Rickettsiales bacterium]|nr:hypothetical protein [Rickettsiales bacterium]